VTGQGQARLANGKQFPVGFGDNNSSLATSQ